MTLRRLVLFLGFVLFGVATILFFSRSDGVSLSANLGLVAAGLACWIAAALP